MLRAFILCAGKGERLWPLSTLLPKCLWPIAGQPCARLIVEAVWKHLPDVEVSICCLEKDMTLYWHEFRDSLPQRFRIFPTKEPMGTAGQFAEALSRLDEPFIIHYGDCLVDVDYADLLAVHNKSRASATLVLTNQERSEFGQVRVHAKYDAVIGFKEKPVMEDRYIWTGVAVLSPVVKRFLKPGSDFGADVFPLLLSKGHHVHSYRTHKPYYDIGTIRAYNDVNVLAEQGKLFK